MIKYLNVGCGTHYAEGWINTDVWEDEATKPDVVVSPGDPYPFEDNEIDAIFMGHVLEHISWHDVGPFIAEMNRIAKPGAPVLAVGPDVYKTLHRWKDGKEPWHMLESVLEHQDVEAVAHRLAKDIPEYEGVAPDWWDGAAHHWNCHEKRLFGVMNSLFSDCEIYSDIITPNAAGKNWKDDKNNIVWPVVGYWHWQCAVMGYAK